MFKFEKVFTRSLLQSVTRTCMQYAENPATLCITEEFCLCGVNNDGQDSDQRRKIFLSREARTKPSCTS